MTQVGLGIQKVCFCQSQKGAKKKFEKFSCFFLLRIAKKIAIFFSSKISKSPKVGTVLGPFGPKKGQRDFFLKYNTITAFLLSHFIMIQKIIENGQAVLEIFNFEKSSELIG